MVKARTFKTVKELDAIKAPGMYRDAGKEAGPNLYLQVTAGRGDAFAKSWVFRFMLAGKARYMGLGGYPLVPLMEARDAALEARRLVRQGMDPIDARNAKAATDTLEQARAIPFKEFAESYITAHESTWSNPKHRQQWRNTMKGRVYPVMGNVAIHAINTDLVLRAIEPEWKIKTESMNRIRGRIEKILDAAKAKGLRSGDNPARWVGHLKDLLPARKRLQRVKHHPALQYSLAPAFMAKLRTQESISAYALEFCILVAARTCEVIGARWSEFDLEAATWTIPPERIKKRRQHIVPLCPRALAVIEKMIGAHKTWVFPGYKGKHLGDNAMLTLVDRMGYGQITPHGMRSMFKTWAGEQTPFPNDVVEVCLAHVEGNATVAAYLRTEIPGMLYFDKRQKLLQAWESYLAGDVRPVAAAE